MSSPPFFATISCIILFFICSFTASAQTILSKAEACKSPDTYLKNDDNWNHDNPWLQVAGLKNAYVEQFIHSLYNENDNRLYYIVRQDKTFTRGDKKGDDYSFYEYDCKKKGIRKIFGQNVFRMITPYFPIEIYKHARMNYINGKYVTIGFYQDACVRKKCTHDYYEVTIDFAPHQYQIMRRPEKWNPNNPDITSIKVGFY